jgi:pimeloyl-ACP methyl ester carboxylesterase
MADDYGNPDPEWLKIDWRNHVRQIDLPGATVNYAEIGEGEPIVFVHGISGSWQNWLENMPHFAAHGRRAIALDLPGFGASPLPSWPIEMRAYGRLLHDFCAKLGVERGATLVGNSMGGLVAGEAVLSSPERFDRLVFVSAAGLINTWMPRERGAATSHAWRTFGPGFGAVTREIVARRRSRYLMFRFFMRYPGRLRKELLWEQMASGLPAAAFGDAMASVIEYDARHRLQEIELPVLIVWGTDDWVIPSAAAHSYKRRIPHARLAIFDRTGHVPQLERPVRFNRLLEEFVSR